MLLGRHALSPREIASRRSVFVQLELSARRLATLPSTEHRAKRAFAALRGIAAVRVPSDPRLARRFMRPEGLARVPAWPKDSARI